jgi:SAM-dependent methyltransferase
MNTSRHLPGRFPSRSGSAFVQRALWHFGRRAVKRRTLAILNPAIERRRDSAGVKAAYDAERGYTLERIDQLTLDELVHGSADRFDEAPPDDFVLLGDRVVWQPTRVTRTFLIEEMHRAVAACAPPGGRVAEVGSGNGRNLLYLKSRLPDIRFAGFELSPVSVDLARALSARFALPAEFVCANACEPLPPAAAGSADVVYSAHALEMMPRIFAGAIDNMLRVARSHVLFFEPVPELWPRDARGLASKARAYVMDRLRGFMPVVRDIARAQGWDIVEARRLGTSTNPVNETALVHLTRRA